MQFRHVLAVGVLAAVQLGCAAADLAGTVGDYVVPKAFIDEDTYEVVLRGSADDAYEAAFRVMDGLTLDLRRDDEARILRGTVNGSDVEVAVALYEESISRVAVQARKHWLPDPDTAKSVALKISAWAARP